MFRMADMTKLLDNGASQSGGERNHFFHNVNGEEFVDLSRVSGLDHPGDGRSFAVLDMDRDGWQDIAFVNSNRPLLQLMRNRMGAASRGTAVYFRFVGGNHTSSASRWSHRDGIGTRVVITLADGRRLVREHQAGTGLAAQNSSLLHIGIGAQGPIQSAEIQWPSGKVQNLGRIAGGSLVTVYEDPNQSSSGRVFEVEPFVVSKTKAPTDKKSQPPQILTFDDQSDATSRLRLYTTMAPWCEPCRAELPYFRSLEERFTRDELAVYGIPIDSAPEELEQWIENNAPSYRVLDVDGREEDSAQGIVQDALSSQSLPASIVTDSQGGVLLVRRGPPTVSQIRKLLETSGSGDFRSPEGGMR